MKPSLLLQNVCPLAGSHSLNCAMSWVDGFVRVFPNCFSCLDLVQFGSIKSQHLTSPHYFSMAARSRSIHCIRHTVFQQREAPFDLGEIRCQGDHFQSCGQMHLKKQKPHGFVLIMSLESQFGISYEVLFSFQELMR